MESDPTGYQIELREITKVFGGTPALKRISMGIKPGEVIGLVGENGAGKSTLIKILSGVHQPDGGELLWQGKAIRLGNPHHALQRGIATIHQELNYFEKLTVAENLCLGEAWPRHFWGGVDWKKLFERAGERLRQFELEIDPGSLFQDLSPAQRQEVAIVRALSHQARLLILDEPTASLTAPEVERLMTQLQRLRREGMTIIYVSHRLDEILQITDRILVLRDGELVAGYPSSEATIPKLVQDMVGRVLSTDPKGASATSAGQVLLEVRNLARNGLFEDISFQLRAGEILGLAGLVGAGRSELARCIYGLYPPDAGTMRYRGSAWKPEEPSEACRAGIVYVPEERKRHGFVLGHSVREGISIGFLRQLGRTGLISPNAERSRAQEVARTYAVKTRTMEQPIGTLSGGNQQKVLLGRWLSTDPTLVILDEPTRGVDVGAKSEIHRLVNELAAQGKGILLISSDLPEVLHLSHRVLVLHQGRIAAELQGPGLTQENVLFAASGLSR